ncbi:MAG: hypothetical protein J5802_04155 [Butyrivibrio sp.]|nr:hypothetical protein [Butyrivibrio sp.]
MISVIIKKNKFLLVAVIAVLFIEIFGFNFKFWLYGNMGQPITPTFYFEDGTPVVSGQSYTISGNMELESESIGVDVKNIHIGVLDCNEESWVRKDRQCVLHVLTSVTDEGHAGFYNFVQNVVSPLVSDSMYLPVEAFGKVDKIKINIVDDIDEIVFDSIVVNDRMPFRFNIVRALLLFIVLVGLRTILRGDYYDMADMEKGKRRAEIVCLLFIIGLSVIVLSVQRQTRDWGSSMGYGELARAISEGKAYVSDEADDILSSMENPYDTANRAALGAHAEWDTAFYQGKYYVYFGVVPALFLNLPYYLLTCEDMTYMQETCIIDVLLLISCFALMNELRKRINKKMPLRLFLLLSLTCTFSAGMILLIKTASIYYVAIGTGLVFVCFGLALWMSSLDLEESHNICLWRGMLGSFCMACAVGCRPQFAIASFLGIIIFRNLIKKDSKNRYIGIPRLLMLLLPYVPVAAGLMYYNYIRFGSVFDFGANYNMTGYDMVHMGIHIARIPIGLWYYLFNMPKFNFEFPYMYPTSVDSGYQGFIVSEDQIGGVVWLIPLVLICALDLKKKTRNSQMLYMRIFCYLIVLIVVAVDTIMCGVLVRYQADFRLYLVIPAAIIAMELLNKNSCDKENYNRRARKISLLCIATLAMCLLTVFCQYENPDYLYYAINPVLFCRMKTFFGLFSL